jgi:tRNA threonylcarbamoyladenosine biosynthesis protein TsaE
MNKEFITNNHKETQKLGELLALELRGGEVLCLDGELGAGKTTFTQGLLQGLGAKGPYTSPTFLIMKEYETKISSATADKFQISNKIKKVYHIDAYRIEAQDLLNLGWEEIIADPKNIIIVEWSERIKKILPKEAVRIKFEWLDENQRRITLEA